MAVLGIGNVKAIEGYVRRNFEIQYDWTFLRNRHREISLEIAQTPSWFQAIMLADTLPIKTSASWFFGNDYLTDYEPGCAYMPDQNAYSRVHGVIKYRHYNDFATLWHEYAHRIDHVLNSNFDKWVRESFSDKNEQWKNIATQFAEAKDGHKKDEFFRYISDRRSSYRAKDYPQEAFAEVLSAYVDEYVKSGGKEDSVSRHMELRFPILWPEFKKTVMPEIQAFADKIINPDKEQATPLDTENSETTEPETRRWRDGVSKLRQQLKLVGPNPYH
jgi:hypothetical protein